MADFDQDRFDESLNKFYTKLSALSDSLGRGTTSGKTPGSTGGKQAKTPETPEERAYADKIKRLTKLHEKGVQLSKEDSEALKEHTKQTEKLTDAQDDLEQSMKYTRKQLLGLGKDLLTGKGSLGDAAGSLANIFDRSSTKAGKAIWGFAAGAGFALGAMENFAKEAASLGGFADLSAFSVGSIRQAKLMSALGDSFIKVVEQSEGGFKAFGSNSQEAVENLSALSRGLRLGSYTLSSTMKNTLGKDLVNTMNKAAKSTAAMGLSQQDQADLMGSIASTVQLNAKDEQDAQRKLVEQYARTVDSARTLSNTFGISSKEILKSIENFNKSTAGKAAALQGVSGAQEIKTALQASGVQGSEDDLNRMALALAKGERGVAGTYTNAESQATLDAVNRAVESARASGNGKITAEGMQQGMIGQRGSFEAIGAQRQNLGAKGQEGLFDTGVAAASLAKKLDLQAKAAAGDKKAAEELAKTFKTSEASNIQSMDQLQGALDSLRNVVVGLTAAIIGLTGMLAPLVMGGAGALIGGLMGKGGGGLLGSIFGKNSKGPAADSLSGWKSGPTASAGAGSGMGDKLSGLGKGLGDLLTGLGKGIGGAAQGVLQGLAAGISAFKPQVLMGAAILGGSIALIGAGIAGATWLVGKALPTFAEGLKAFDDISGDNLIKIGGGLAAMGAGAVVFAAGMIAATAGSVITGIMSLFGAKSPLERIMEFVPYANAISALGQGMLNFGNGIIALNTGLAGLDVSKLKTLKENMASISQVNMNSPAISSNFNAGLGNIAGPNAANGSSMTPEMVTQVMSYLSNIQNELQAIRGNTKSGPSVAPVRLS
jgi:hypothetical protein